MPPTYDAGSDEENSASTTQRAGLYPKLFRMGLRARVAHAWSYAPVHEHRLSWSSFRSMALRSLFCGALLFAVPITLQLQPHIDLYPTYVAATFANEGRWDRIYHRSIWLHDGIDPEWDARSAQLIGGQQLHGTSFVYHPWYLQALRPIVAHVTYARFQAEWITFSKLCIVGIGLALSVLLAQHSLLAQALFTLVIGVASTTIRGIEFGQNVLPALLFSLAAAASWRSRMPLWIGGVLAALAWACKPWCALLLVLCFVLRGTRAGLVTTLGVGFVMGILPNLVLPGALLQDYRAMTLAMTSVSVAAHNNLSILSIIERTQYSDWSNHLFDWKPRLAALSHRTLAMSLGLVVFATAAWTWWRHRPSANYVCAAFLALMLVPLGICWTHYFVFALPLACLVSFDSRSCSPVLRVAGVSLLAMLLASMDSAGLNRADFQAYLTAPPLYPWREALPMCAVVAVSLGALRFAPTE